MISLATIFFFAFLLGSIIICQEIGPELTQKSFNQKRKTYCKMMSFHFLDNDMETFKRYTVDFGDSRKQLFRNKVSNRLAENCAQKITKQQIMELSRLVQNPQGKQQQIQKLQDKYIQYFQPQQNIIQKILKQVKAQSDQQVKRQIQKFHQARQQMQKSTQIAVKGFKAVQMHIHETTSQLTDSHKKLSQTVVEINNNFQKAAQSIKQSFQKINFTEIIENVKGHIFSHPHVKMIQQYWEQL